MTVGSLMRMMSCRRLPPPSLRNMPNRSSPATTRPTFHLSSQSILLEDAATVVFIASVVIPKFCWPMGDAKLLGDLKIDDEIIGTTRLGFYRRYVKTRVLAHWGTHKPAYRLMLADGTAITASADHRFLSDRGWKFVTGTANGRNRRPHLTTGNKLMGVGMTTGSLEPTSFYKQGYLCGIIRGDGDIGVSKYGLRTGGEAISCQFSACHGGRRSVAAQRLIPRRIRGANARLSFSEGSRKRSRDECDKRRLRRRFSRPSKSSSRGLVLNRPIGREVSSAASSMLRALTATAVFESQIQTRPFSIALKKASSTSALHSPMTLRNGVRISSFTI